MVLHVLRTLFILLMGAVGFYYLQQPQFFGRYTWMAMAIAIAIAVFTVCVDILSPRRKLAIFSGSFFGLIVGLMVAYGASFIVRLVIEQQMVQPEMTTAFRERRESIIQFVNTLIGVTTSYLAISFILQTKDDFRFIIPFVEFTKQTRGPRPILLDTSVLIDGRISDIAATGIVDSQLIVPRFVIEELQRVADSSDRLKRNRGRRGLDVLAKLQKTAKLEVVLWEGVAREDHNETEVDAKLLLLAKELNARVLTNDFNLNKVGQLHGVDIVNINELANAVKPVVIAGENMRVRITKPGQEAGQGVGYLDDGTMVVIDHGRPHVGNEVEFVVTSNLQTSAGKMIFGRMMDSPAPVGGGDDPDDIKPKGPMKPVNKTGPKPVVPTPKIG